jgi:acyl-CoA synthetase (NDP forming)
VSEADPLDRFASLTPLLAARSIAVVGASSDPSRIGGRPIANLLALGFAGAIYPVNPNRAEVQGLRAYGSVADLPEAPDVAIVAVPADKATEAIAALGVRGVKGAIVFTSGFAEVGAAGSAAQQAMAEEARLHGMRLVGPNCLGLFNARIALYAIFSSLLEGGPPKPGRIGIASQSGAYGAHLFSCARDRGIGTPICVTTGNEADVTIGDVIGWLVGDPETDVIAAYAEGVREADTLLAALAAARAARKPVVMMKVGRSDLGRTAARTHTASLVGDDRVIDAVLAEFGVVRAHSTEEMLDIAHTATRRVYPARNGVGVFTISGGAGVLISDAAEQAGLSLPPMPDGAQAELKALIPFCATRNPVDCTAQVFNDMSMVGRFADTIMTAGDYPSLLAFFTGVPNSRRIGPALFEQLRTLPARYPDRLCVLSILANPAHVAEYEAEGWICHSDPTRAVVAISAMSRFGGAFAASAAAPHPVVPAITLPETTPDEAEAKRILAAAGIATVPERACASADEAVDAARAFGYPVVLKILSPDIAHKTDIGGVLLGVQDEAAVRSGFTVLIERARRLAPGARIRGVLVAREVRNGIECILGVHRDPLFGPVAAFGLGGIFVEALNEVVIHRCPFGDDVALAMIRAVRGAKLLAGARGRPAADLPALAAMLSRLSVFASQAGGRLTAVDLNPVIALPEGAFVADAVIEIRG